MQRRTNPRLRFSRVWNEKQKKPPTVAFSVNSGIFASERRSRKGLLGMLFTTSRCKIINWALVVLNFAAANPVNIEFQNKEIEASNCDQEEITPWENSIWILKLGCEIYNARDTRRTSVRLSCLQWLLLKLFLLCLWLWASSRVTARFLCNFLNIEVSFWTKVLMAVEKMRLNLFWLRSL